MKEKLQFFLHKSPVFIPEIRKYELLPIKANIYFNISLIRGPFNKLWSRFAREQNGPNFGHLLGVPPKPPFFIQKIGKYELLFPVGTIPDAMLPVTQFVVFEF